MDSNAQQEVQHDTVEKIEADETLTKEEMKTKIKEIQKLKEEQSKREELEKEIKRREDGKNMLEAQRKNAELKQKLEMEQRKKEREADNEYKKRLLAELQREKEERRLRNQNLAASASSSTPPQPSVIPVVNSDDCRVCFQFPDGKRVNAVFPSSAKFQAVYDYVAENSLFEGSYELHRTYPRGAIKDYDKDLVELKLTPASVVAVVKHTTTQNLVVSKTQELFKSIGYLLLTMIYSPLATVVQFFTTLFGFNIQKPGETSTYEQKSKRRNSRERNNRDGDTDDEATWNGNSTQQL